MENKDFNILVEVRVIKQRLDDFIEKEYMIRNQSIINAIQSLEKSVLLLTENVTNKNNICAARSSEHEKYGEDIDNIKKNIDLIRTTKIHSFAATIISICVPITAWIIFQMMLLKINGH